MRPVARGNVAVDGVGSFCLNGYEQAIRRLPEITAERRRVCGVVGSLCFFEPALIGSQRKRYTRQSTLVITAFSRIPEIVSRGWQHGT